MCWVNYRAWRSRRAASRRAVCPHTSLQRPARLHSPSTQTHQHLQHNDDEGRIWCSRWRGVVPTVWVAYSGILHSSSYIDKQRWEEDRSARDSPWVATWSAARVQVPHDENQIRTDDMRKIICLKIYSVNNAADTYLQGDWDKVGLLFRQFQPNSLSLMR